MKDKCLNILYHYTTKFFLKANYAQAGDHVLLLVFSVLLLIVMMGTKNGILNVVKMCDRLVQLTAKDVYLSFISSQCKQMVHKMQLLQV